MTLIISVLRNNQIQFLKFNTFIFIFKTQKSILKFNRNQDPANWNIQKLLQEIKIRRANEIAYRTSKNCSKNKDQKTSGNQEKKSIKNKREKMASRQLDRYLKKNPIPNYDYQSQQSSKAFPRTDILYYRKPKIYTKCEHDKQLQNCTFKPKINQYSQQYSSIKQQQTVYQKLYKSRKKSISPSPLFTKQQEVFDRNFKAKKAPGTPRLTPRGFDKQIQRIKNGREQYQKKKRIQQYIPHGQNYQKIRNKKISPFKVAQKNKKSYNSKSNVQSKQKTIKKQKQKIVKNLKSYNRLKQNVNQSPLLILDVKISADLKGKIQIYVNSKPQQLAKNFCQKYGLIKEAKITIQQIIKQKIKQLK